MDDFPGLGQSIPQPNDQYDFWINLFPCSLFSAHKKSYESETKPNCMFHFCKIHLAIKRAVHS